MDRAEQIVYGRDQHAARIFISSRMDGSLKQERELTAEVIDRHDLYKPWWWEKDAPAGAQHSETECIRLAGASDGLILLIGDVLSDIIYAEYRAAKSERAQTFIFVREWDERSESVEQFLREERDSCVYRTFQNTAELETLVTQAISAAAIRALRERQVRLMDGA